MIHNDGEQIAIILGNETTVLVAGASYPPNKIAVLFLDDRRNETKLGEYSVNAMVRIEFHTLKSIDTMRMMLNRCEEYLKELLNEEQYDLGTILHNIGNE